ncbi:serine/threonine-protein kinase 11-interacting protein isoform X2 [Anopheles aquasalis]|uniref:serine/threonine-protein kinase 11-interacting protein isoform X2 n=1 Tax=Anopheles aquasalis TaxID=42839 RepID=UPI00215B50C7|nr:serine/threonine-protein kinase 11-interacting protein isoform X2 [Anopheles aquasalis]
MSQTLNIARMDPTQITALAKLLKESGDKVLNSEFKLTLSGSLLRALNDSFSLIVDKNEILPPQSFQVVKPNNAKSDVFRDLQFVYDFVQKTVILSLNQFINDDPYESAVDISKFRSLRSLEVQKIPINQIIGMQHLRGQLQTLACVRSISDVSDVLVSCGGDNLVEGNQWRSLKSINFAYNMLDYVDSSLELTPWLELLDLSHNQLVSVSAVRCLPNLRVLNLSYNRLNHIPVFHSDATRKLRVLQLANNFLEDLEGLCLLSHALTELDISANFIIDHAALLPLSTLCALRSVCLLDNPLACHPKHRQATARYLNSATSDYKFLLDNEPLSRYEKTLTGNYDSYKAILVPSIVSTLGMVSSGRSTPNSSTRMATKDRDTGIGTTPDNMNQSVTSQKKVPMRTAVISESDHVDQDSNIANSHMELGKTGSSRFNFESSREHLKTKEALEKLRDEHGNEWLQNYPGHMVRNLVGFSPDHDKEYGSIEHYQPTKSLTTREYISTSQQVNATPAKPSPIQLDSVATVQLEDEIQILPDPSIENTANSNSSLDQDTMDPIGLDGIYAIRIEEEEESETEDNEVLYHATARESEAKLSIVVSDKSIKEKDTVGKTKTRWGIKTLEACERPTSTRIILSFDIIKSDKKERVYEMDPHDCQLLESRLRNVLSKRPLSEMNLRLYKCVVCNTKSARQIDPTRVSEEVHICPACHGPYLIQIKENQVKKESSSNIVGSSCSDQLPAVSNEDTSNPTPGTSGMFTAEPSNFYTSAWKSPLKNKPKSSGSLNDSSSCSRISQTGSSCDSNQSVAGSTNSERDRDVDLLGNDSDIEVLSNPSQSSIEVLDRGYHPSRKASEERRISSLETVNKYNTDSKEQQETLSTEFQHHHQLESSSLKISADEESRKTDEKEDASMKKSPGVAKLHAPVASKKGFLTSIHLTESSSSGSVTDSVCTAYESTQGSIEVVCNKSNEQESAITITGQESLNESSRIEQKTSTESISIGVENATKVPTVQSDSTVLSSVLGVVLQSTNMLMAKTPKGKAEESSVKIFYEPIRYNYYDYSNVDHRLKLYLYQNLFEDTNESLKWLVSCIVFDDNRADEWPSGFDGLFIMSTTKFYVMKKVAAENDDPTTWLKKYIAGTIDRVGIAQPLPWKIGIKFIVSAIGGVHVVLQDILRTDKLMLFFNENPLPPYCTLDYQPSDLLNSKLKKAANGDAVKMVMIVNFCDVVSNDELQSVQLSTLVITAKHLMLVPDIRWINESSAYPVVPKFTQLVIDIVELEEINDLSCRLHYANEQEDKEETWSLIFATETAKESTVNTICQLWEMFFGVPMTRRQ